MQRRTRITVPRGSSRIFDLLHDYCVIRRVGRPGVPEETPDQGARSPATIGYVGAWYTSSCPLLDCVAEIEPVHGRGPAGLLRTKDY